jgi:hypothetical protein
VSPVILVTSVLVDVVPSTVEYTTLKVEIVPLPRITHIHRRFAPDYHFHSESVVVVVVLLPQIVELSAPVTELPITDVTVSAFPDASTVSVKVTFVSLNTTIEVVSEFTASTVVVGANTDPLASNAS